ncbi:MAG: helix-turn-helix domain-containing protein [Bacteroidota bacterium]|nr:helix-turn-helix domain-containing protein [Bacteroidota bacterium]
MRRLKLDISLIFDVVVNNRNERLIKTLGATIRELRIERHLSQAQLAVLSEMMPSQVGRIERGEINPSVSTTYALAVALRVDMNTLIKVEFPNP